MANDQAVVDALQIYYPRFYQHPTVQKLNQAVLDRVGSPENTRCMVFPSKDAAKRCCAYIRKRKGPNIMVHDVSFSLTQHVSQANQTWARFSAVLFSQEDKDAANEFWGEMGDGISSRHAQFCLDRFQFMSSVSLVPDLQTGETGSYGETIPMEPWQDSDADAKKDITTIIARLVTSDQPGQEAVNPDDVYLFPKGMCAIRSVASILAPGSAKASEAVVFGWPYGSTPRCVRASEYERFTFFSQGTSEELDQLEASLASGNRIASLFCEVPSNPLCATPDLHRIRSLANQYHFAVVCDETIGTFINVDVLPYVDVVITSLTKAFSGACNVMGGSAVLNIKSPWYDLLKSKLNELHEDLVFPLDAKVLLHNCLDFPTRIRKMNTNALAIANLLKSCESILQLNHPSMVATRSLYEQYRRPSGGYGALLSLVFRDPNSAIRFYDAIDLPKGPSLGANFTLILPYSQLAHAYELDWAESHGIAKHIIRISAGLEDESILISKVDQALQEALSLEGHRTIA
ncbi:hypothetical protein TCE0_038f12539 [Talaromyces pinophilus]|uniref:Cystathionine gamma-synthase n=1 Tax=Talaromyces pinophilus TaxID=128442 RepID=A0A0B8N3U9_TALPI|nr:hypothetical protein TCE0_038f12539 [Talaromyces pinophilus]